MFNENHFIKVASSVSEQPELVGHKMILGCHQHLSTKRLDPIWKSNIQTEQLANGAIAILEVDPLKGNLIWPGKYWQMPRMQRYL